MNTKELARSLRKLGRSIPSISDELNIPRGTINYWCKDIELNVEQKEKLRQNGIRGGALGRAIAVELNKSERITRQNSYSSEGEKLISTRTRSLNCRSCLILGRRT